jgi:hypothetical protein
MWAVENLISGSDKALDIMLEQELLKYTLYVVNNAGELEIKKEGVQLLDIIVKRWNKFEMDEKEEISKSLMKYIRKHPRDYIALQCLHRTLDEWELSSEQVAKILNNLIDNLIIPSNEIDGDVFYFTINLLLHFFKSNEFIMTNALEYLLHNNIKLSDIINRAVKEPKLFNSVKDLLRIVAIIHDADHPCKIKYLCFDKVETNLVIPIIFQF